MAEIEEPAFWLQLDPRIKKVVLALEELLKEDPSVYSTEDLMQAWATLDYGHSMMRSVVYQREDFGPAMVKSVEALKQRGVIRNG